MQPIPIQNERYPTRNIALLMPKGVYDAEAEKHWTYQEKWVWERIKDGILFHANFNLGSSFGGKLDPKDVTNWPENRVLRPEFLQTILIERNIDKEAIPPRGIYLFGAWIKSLLDLCHTVIDYPLNIDRFAFRCMSDILIGMRARQMSYHSISELSFQV